MRCNVVLASVQVVNARRRRFGHVLRMNENVPARQAMYIAISMRNATRVDNETFVLLLLLFLMHEYKSVCL